VGQRWWFANPTSARVGQGKGLQKGYEASSRDGKPTGLSVGAEAQRTREGLRIHKEKAVAKGGRWVKIT